MLYYCLYCRKNAESKNQKAVLTKIRRWMLLWKCVVCNSKLKFLKEQKAWGLLSKLTRVKIPILSDSAISNTSF